MALHYLVRVLKIEVTDAEDFSLFGEPGSHAEWRVDINIGGNVVNHISNDFVRDGTVFALAVEGYVAITSIGDPGDIVEVSGYEGDDSSKNDQLPRASTRISQLASMAGPQTVTIKAGDFGYSVTWQALRLDLAAWIPLSYGGMHDNGAVYSSRAHASVELSDGSLVVGLDHGGIWRVDVENSSATSLVDAVAGSFRVLSIAADNHPQPTIFAGCFADLLGSIAADPPVFKRATLPANVAEVYGVAIAERQARVLIATNVGLFWATYPNAMSGKWTVARTDKFFDVRVVEDQGVDQVLATRWVPAAGSSPVMAGPLTAAGLTLVDVPIPAMTRTVGTGPTALTLTADYATIDACRSQPKVWYVAGTSANDGELVGVARSPDAGLTWTSLPATLGDPNSGSFDILHPDLAGSSKNGGGIRKIAAHPEDANCVAVPWMLVFVCANAASPAPTWTIVGGSWRDPMPTAAYLDGDVHVHADAHWVQFRSGRPDAAILLTDGGLTTVSAVRSNAPTVSSSINDVIPTAMVYGPAAPDPTFWGGVGVSRPVPDAVGPFAVGTGLQDLGCALRRVDRLASHPWEVFAGGDGAWVGMAGDLLLVSPDVMGGDAGAIQIASWDKGSIGEWTTIPYVDLLGTTQPKGLRNGPRRTPQHLVVEVVTRPTPSAAGDAPAMAIGSPFLPPAEVPAAMRAQDDPTTTDVNESLAWVPSFTLFTLRVDPAVALAWRPTAAIPAIVVSGGPMGVSTRTGGISAVASHNGLTAVVGTTDGRFFEVDTVATTNPPASLTVRVPIAENIDRIATDGQRWFAISSTGLYQRSGNSWARSSIGSLGITATRFLGLDVSNNPARPLVVVSTDTGVWGSDSGQPGKWFDLSAGLPQSIEARDLRFGWFEIADGHPEEFLVLGTFGRGVWSAWVEAMRR